MATPDARRARVAPLLGLEVRRGLRALFPVLPLVLLLTLGGVGGDAGLVPPDVRGVATTSEVAGLARRTVWIGGVLALLALGGAHLARGPRRAEARLLRSLPVARALPAGARLLGTSFAGALVLVCVGLCAELRGGDGPALRPSVSLDLPEPVRVGPGEVWTVAVDPGPTGEGAWLELAVVAALGRAPTTEVELLLARPAAANGQPLPDARRRVARRRVTRRESVGAPLPPGAGAVRVELRVTGEGDLVLPAGRSLGLWVPGGSARRGSLELAVRAALALLALGALAQALGRHLNPIASCAGVLALWGLARLLLPGASWLPDGDLPSALERVAEGRLPAPLALAPVLGTVGCLVLAGLLGRFPTRAERP